jgi:hypothetical protein
MGGVCGTYGLEEKCIQGFGGEPEVKITLGRHRLKWGDNIKMDIYEVEWRGMDCADLSQGR